MLRWQAGILALAVLGAGSAPAQENAGAPAPTDEQSIAEAANNPTAPLAQLSLRNVVLPPPNSRIGWSNSFQPQLALPTAVSSWMPVDTILRLTVPIQTSPNPDSTSGLGDTQLLVLAVDEVPGGWGRWGLGPAAVFPTANSDLLGQGKWQLGVGAALVLSNVPNWQIGMVATEYDSVGGSPSRSAVHQLVLQPTLTRVWPGGWFAGLGDFPWTVDWKNDDVTLPVSLQVGRVFRIGPQLVSLSCEAGVVALHPDDVVSPSWVASAQLAFLFPEVIRKRRIGGRDETREGANSSAQ